MSAVVYDVGYDTRIFNMRKNMVTVRFLASQDIDCPKNFKISKHTATFKL